MSTEASRWMLTKLGKVRMSLDLPLVEGCHLRKLMDIAAPGQVILRRFNSYLDGKLIPGKYSHSGVIVSNQFVVHAVAEGVQYCDTLDFAKNADGIWIGACHDAGFSSSDMVEWAKKQVGVADYDFDFKAEPGEESPKALFCHELTALALEHGGKRIVPVLQGFPTLAGIVQHEVFLAQQFIDSLTKLYEAP